MEPRRIAVVGGGPAGLYFSYLWKRRHPRTEVELFERNPRNATWGFGVVFSDRALDFLRIDDAETAGVLADRMERWRDLTINHRGQSVAIDGVGFSAIGRLDLLQILQNRAESVGVQLHFDQPAPAMDSGHDLIVAADGVNSSIRKHYEGDFGTSAAYLNAKFIWFGTAKRFATLTQTFVETSMGTFNAHHYPYSQGMSTFIVECDRETWLRYGFADRSTESSVTVCEDVFSAVLDGHPLLSNHSIWRNFPWIANKRWSYRNMVLIGDAAKTAHYSIGSGTRLALEDAIALANAIEREPVDLAKALVEYERARRPVVEKLTSAAKMSASWYEDFPAHMKLDPLPFVHDYITRSGRIDRERLREQSPRLVEQFEAHGTLDFA